MILLTSVGGRPVTIRPRAVSAVKELTPIEDRGPACSVQVGERSVYNVRGTFEEVTRTLTLDREFQASLRRAVQETRESLVELSHGLAAGAADDLVGVVLMLTEKLDIALRTENFHV